MLASRSLFMLATSICCFSVASAFATAKTSPNQSPSQEEDCGNLPIGPQRVEARHIESKGIGYDQGYTSIEGFFTVPNCLEGSWLPFLDVRGHAFNNGKFATNLGLGLRYMTSLVWGLNTYYDYRNTNHFHYNQVGVGLEMLGKLIDLRINGYLPVGKKNSNFYHTRLDGFQGHYLLLSRKREFAMKGANAEIGFHFGQFGRLQMYSAAGPYYFEGQGKVAWGGEGRYVINFYDYFRVQINGSYDKIFKGIVQGEVAVTIPFGKRKAIKKRNSYTCPQELLVKERALQRVDRQEIVVVDKKRTINPAINPETGQPYFFWFVNNTSHSNGTFESPFNTLIDAQNASGPGQTIYVFSGDGTSAGMNQGITLKDGQSLLGSGTPQTFPTTNGVFTVSPLTSQMPIINNVMNVPLGAAVVLAERTQVSGIHFDQAPIKQQVFCKI